MMSEALMYGKVAFAACVAPDAFQLVENVLEQPNISSACVASVRTLSHANIATRIGGAVFLAPSICRRILFGTPWEQAATLAAGATALYCTGGAVVPTLIFAEGAGLVAFGADGTKNAIASTAKKVTTACKNYFSSIASGLRPSVRQTFQNFYARIRGEREAQRTIDRQQRIEEARQATKQDQDMQKPNDSPAPQP